MAYITSDPEISFSDALMLRAAALVDDAARHGFILTIERQSLLPLAMGNAENVIEVRPARKMTPETLALMWGTELSERARERQRQQEEAIARFRDTIGAAPTGSYKGPDVFAGFNELGEGPSIETGGIE